MLTFTSQEVHIDFVSYFTLTIKKKLIQSTVETCRVKVDFALKYPGISVICEKSS
jgi:hypothetical protein